MGNLIILVGGIGSGKTTFAKKLNREIVSSDSVRKELYGDESIIFNEEISDMLIKRNNISLDGMGKDEIRLLKERLCEEYVFIVARKRCCMLLEKGCDVVYDSTNFKKKYRTEILQEAKGLYDACEVFVMDVPLEVAIKRNNSRERKEPRSIIEEIFSLMEFPTYSEGFDRIYTVDYNSRMTLVPKFASEQMLE